MERQLQCLFEVSLSETRQAQMNGGLVIAGIEGQRPTAVVLRPLKIADRDIGRTKVRVGS